MKLIDFIKQFPDEQSCKDHFRKQRQKEGITCRKCKGTKHYWMQTIEQFQCKGCRTRTTLRSGTVMESSNLSFRDWYIVMHLMTSTKKGISAKEMQRQLGFNRYEAVWFMMQENRVAMGARDDQHELSGFTELDKGYFTTVESATVGETGKKSKRGRGSETQTPVLVMAQNEYVENPKKYQQHSRCKFLKMKAMPDLTSKTINQIVTDSMNPEIKVKTDGLLSNYHPVDDTYLQNYLDEFTYRLNRRYSGDKLFDLLLIACMYFCWII